MSDDGTTPLETVPWDPAPAAPPSAAELLAWAQRVWRTLREMETRLNRQAARINELTARVAELEG